MFLLGHFAGASICGESHSGSGFNSSALEFLEMAEGIQVQSLPPG
jgi:hypothetical protein